MKKLLLSVLFMGLLQTSHAVITDNGSHTSDSQTGLDWLDLTITADQSYDYVSSQLGTGGVYDGYRYASAFEVATLLTNWNGVVISTTDTGSSYNTDFDTATFYNETTTSIDQLIQWLGATYTNDTVGNGDPNDTTYAVFGLVTDICPVNFCSAANNHIAAWLHDYAETDNGTTQDLAFMYNSSHVDNTSLSHVGSFLVKANGVPETTSILLLLIGLTGIISLKRKL